ncbi:MAG TPA: IclR family transcriptional regulator [Xanthobacteraceae bacterium]
MARGKRGPLSSPASGENHNKSDETVRRGSAQPRASVDKTLTKGLQLLEALSEGEESRGISELALQLSLTKSNVHRLLQTLIKCGYVTREASTERYLLSTKLWRVSRRGRPFDALRRPVRPVLRSLVEETNESVLFCVVESDELIPIDQVETPAPVRVFFSVGQPFPIDRVLMNGKGLTALQLIALAGRPQMEAHAAARKVQQQLHKDDAYGEMVLSQISETRNNKYAFSRGEWVSGVNAVAVPVQDFSNNLIGVLSCFGPADRLPDSNFKTIQEILSRGAQEIAKRLSM